MCGVCRRTFGFPRCYGGTIEPCFSSSPILPRWRTRPGEATLDSVRIVCSTPSCSLGIIHELENKPGHIPKAEPLISWTNS